MARKIERESSELQAFLLRMLRALVRRATDGDMDAVVALVAVEKAAKAALAEGVRGLRAKDYTWQSIAEELGMTKQNAEKRWGKGEES